MEFEPFNRLIPSVRAWGLRDVDGHLITDPSAIAIFFSSLKDRNTRINEDFFLYGKTITREDYEDPITFADKKIIGIRVMEYGNIKITTARMEEYLVNLNKIDHNWLDAISAAAEKDARVRELGTEIQKIIPFHGAKRLKAAKKASNE